MGTCKQIVQRYLARVVVFVVVWLYLFAVVYVLYRVALL